MKKFAALLHLIFILCFTSFAQKYTLFTGLSGSLSGNNYHFNASSIFTYADFKPMAAYSIGIDGGYYFEDNLYFKSGLIYGTEGYTITYNFIVQDDNDPLIQDEIKLSIASLRMPIHAGIDIYNGRKIKLNPSLGLEPQFVVNTNETTHFINGSEKLTTNFTDDLNTFLVDIILDIGMEYKFNERFNLSFIPFIGKGIIRLDNDFMKSGKFRYGLQMGLIYNVKKLH